MVLFMRQYNIICFLPVHATLKGTARICATFLVQGWKECWQFTTHRVLDLGRTAIPSFISSGEVKP